MNFALIVEAIFSEKVLLLTSSLGTAASAWVGWRLFHFQKFLEDSKQPRVELWFEPSHVYFGIFSLINIGQASLAIRKLEILQAGVARMDLDVLVSNSGQLEEQKGEGSPYLIDLILQPNSPSIVRAGRISRDRPSQVEIRLQYYDGTFEILLVDTARFGPYRLRGFGTKAEK